jgi:Na+/H+ antiporter NhaD/arsenite permease-like protein
VTPSGAALAETNPGPIAKIHTFAEGPRESAPHVPSLLTVVPFATLLLMIAFMPLVPRFHGWWENNWNRLGVALVLGGVSCLYYNFRGVGLNGAEPGAATVVAMLNHAILDDYIPFIVLLFSLFTISGGIFIGGDFPAHPRVNAGLLFIGAMLASFIGTTGASMLLIRPLLIINRERRHVTHSVIFFIFLVSNGGGLLLPIGDPPLFLGYLRGVPFLWTLNLVWEWLFCVAILLVIYWFVEHYYYSREERGDLEKSLSHRPALELRGGINLVLLAGVILSVALLVPGKALPGTSWIVPDKYLREIVQLSLAAISMKVTAREIRRANAFTFYAIGEVAAIFIGIFVTMQAPIEILNAEGPRLGLRSPAQFFWATGLLSSFLDNAPTYVVFFQAAGSLDPGSQSAVSGVATATGAIASPLLAAVSLGAVLMGACTYIGNGPNFMVKSIAEAYSIPMPSFFGYMGYSLVFLLPVFAAMTWLFLT